MNQYEAHKAIAQQWMTAWPAASGNVPFVFDNDVVDEQNTYARVKMLGGVSTQQTLGAPGNRVYLREGFVQVLLKTPANSGRKALDQLVAALRSVLESQRVGATGTELGVVLEEASPSKEVTDGQFWSSVVTVPFTYRETR